MPTGRDPLTGQHGQTSRTFRGTRREAEKALAAFHVEIVERPATPRVDLNGMDETALIMPLRSWRSSA